MIDHIIKNNEKKKKKKLLHVLFILGKDKGLVNQQHTLLEDPRKADYLYFSKEKSFYNIEGIHNFQFR